MPRAPLRPCTTPSCPELVPYGACTKHRQQKAQARPTASQRGYGSRWQRARLTYLRSHPLCVMECKDEGRVTAATVVEHKIPHRGDQALFWDEGNWQSGCKRCADRKTAREDAGFGNPRKNCDAQQPLCDATLTKCDHARTAVYDL